MCTLRSKDYFQDHEGPRDQTWVIRCNSKCLYWAILLILQFIFWNKASKTQGLFLFLLPWWWNYNVLLCLAFYMVSVISNSSPNYVWQALYQLSLPAQKMFYFNIYCIHTNVPSLAVCNAYVKIQFISLTPDWYYLYIFTDCSSQYKLWFIHLGKSIL